MSDRRAEWPPSGEPMMLDDFKVTMEAGFVFLAYAAFDEREVRFAEVGMTPLQALELAADLNARADEAPPVPPDEQAG
jgi:hypothetical protein